jgi:hypothetical protein
MRTARSFMDNDVRGAGLGFHSYIEVEDEGRELLFTVGSTRRPRSTRNGADSQYGSGVRRIR